MSKSYRVALWLLCGACAVPDAPTTPASSRLIYGADDRLEAYQITDPDELAAMDAVAGLVPSGRIQANGAGWTLAGNNTHADRNDLCPGEPFEDQLAAPICSGVLVEPDVIATAAHCISSGQCVDEFWVFDFAVTAPGTTRVELDADDVYQCDSILDSTFTLRDDWALVRLDRPVVGRTPVAVRSAGTIPHDATVAMIGHPSGLPVKVVTDAPMVDNSGPLWFSAAVDTWRGSSGSPVFNMETWELEGVGARIPMEDWMSNGSCNTTSVCPAEGCPGGTQITRSTQFSHLLAGAPSCVDDGAEPNDLQSHATPTISGVTADLVACAEDPDWFVLQTSPGQTARILTRFTHADGNLDLTVHDATGPIATAASLDDDELIELVAPGDQLYVEVTGANPSYALEVSSSLSVSGPETVSANEWVTFVVEGAENNQRVQLWVGGPRGRTTTPTCATTPLSLGGGSRLGMQAADALGRAQFTAQAPANLPAGATFHVQAITRDTCATSLPHVLTTP